MGRRNPLFGSDRPLQSIPIKSNPSAIACPNAGEVVITCTDTFFPQGEKRTLIVVDQASIHTSDAIVDKRPEWQQRQIEMFELPSYSPELNLIEILWRFTQYEWIEMSVYQSWQSLVNYVEKVLREFGDKYVINFV